MPSDPSPAVRPLRPAMSPAMPNGAWMLWVDGVGGFRVLADGPWSIGGPGEAGDVSICVQAALPRWAATLDRQGHDYLLQRAPAGDRAGNPKGASPSRAAAQPLRHPDRFCLGEGVSFAFGCPHPLSSSARLTIEPPFRFRPHADAVLLLTDTLLLGPTADCHVSTAAATQTVVLFRRDDRWFQKRLPADGGAPAAAVPFAIGARQQVAGLSWTLERA